jgi:hypothetical protein
MHLVYDFSEQGCSSLLLEGNSSSSRSSSELKWVEDLELLLEHAFSA